jgi:hypothetical protein
VNSCRSCMVLKLYVVWFLVLVVVVRYLAAFSHCPGPMHNSAYPFLFLSNYCSCSCS